eukprot:TRINITY_DN353_c0_g1_i4.p2 TRINITY_DN353_c0_g1~~TRINITY_DN353_c0_g1_i4.p2  ORF type:complete len:213 (-),score=53.64 TRINITY_DN353_c0_g1_i4:109-747(-)
MIRRPPRSTLSSSSAASDVYKRQVSTQSTWEDIPQKKKKKLKIKQKKISGWADYINYLLANNCCEKGYIFGKKDLAVWASSSGLAQLANYQVEITNEKDYNKMDKVAYNEKDELLKILARPETDPQKGQSFHKGGIRIDNQKYFSLNWDVEDRNVWYLKKEKGGACVYFGTQCLVMGTWNEGLQQEGGKPQNPGDCNARVEALGNTLKEAGF